jgi:ABC-type branched-subunit amino acid transport system ATPase component
MTTSFIHIVGPNGVGKSTLARDILHGLTQRKKTGLALVDNHMQFEQGLSASEIELIRTYGARHPISCKIEKPDVFIAEHVANSLEALEEVTAALRQNLHRHDTIITMWSPQ